MTTVPTALAPRRYPWVLWLIALVIAALIGVVIASQVVETGVDREAAPAESTAVEPLSAHSQLRADYTAAAGRELSGLRAAAREVPSIADSLRDRIALLKLVIAGDVPVEALIPQAQ